MKKYALIAMLLVVLVVTAGFSKSIPVTDNAVETDKCREVSTVSQIGKPTNYSWELALLGNAVVPGLGYLLIKEPKWALAELGIIGGGFFALFILALNDDEAMVIPGVIVSLTYVGSLIHAPLLAKKKNRLQRTALSFMPVIGRNSVGGLYPKVQFTVTF